ncbi:hypothetical protein MMC31_001485 [Peltigera leucophlebia]|nr:hypothetical protein [Peltigera leucophlebia]
MEKPDKHQALDRHFRSLTTILKALRRIPSSGVAPTSFPKPSTRHLSTINNLCNVLIRTGTEVVAATAAIEPHELSLILSSTEKENQRDAQSSLLLPSYGSDQARSDNENKVAEFVLKHLVWDGKKASKLCFQSHGKNAIRLLKAVVNANDSEETSSLFCLYVVGAGLPKCLTRIRKGQFLEFFKQDFSNVPRTNHCPMILADRWRRFARLWTELFPDGPYLDFAFSEPGLPETVVMSTDHARAIHNAMKQSIGNLEKWINETKETSSIDSFISAVYATTLSCLVSCRSWEAASMNYPKQHTGDHLDVGLDYEDDDEDDPETEDIYMSLDWKENCLSWLNLICLHSSSSISLTKLSMNPKHSWLLDGHYVFADRKLSDYSTMEPWRDTIRQIFGESADWVQKLEKLNEVPMKKGAHGSPDPL